MSPQLLMRSTALWTLLFLLAPAWATSFVKYCEHRLADVDNDYYFVVKRNDPNPLDRYFTGPVTITIARRKAGSEAIPNMKAAENTIPTAQNCVDPTIWVRGGDPILSQIQLDLAPEKVLIRKGGKGIVTVDVYGFNIGNDPSLAVTAYSVQGKVLYRHNRDAIIKLMEEVHRGDGYVKWFDMAWIDDKRDELVFVGFADSPKGWPRVTVSMNLATGELKKAGTELVERAFSERNPNALNDAFMLVKEWKLQGFEKFYPPILDDPKSSLYHRIWAATLMALNGDRRGVDLIKQTSVEPAAPMDKGAQYYALMCLKNVIGNEAGDLIVSHIHKNPEISSGAWWAMYELPASISIPQLRKLLDCKETVATQLFAMDCIRAKGREAAAAVPELIQILEGQDRVLERVAGKASTHNFATLALQMMGPAAEAALPVLIKRAEESDPIEWARVKDRQPEIARSERYSKNEFVHAICKIREK